MAITILAPVVEGATHNEAQGLSHGYDDDSMSDNSDSDVEMGGVNLSQKQNYSGKIKEGIVLPGEVVTDDPKWMR